MWIDDQVLARYQEAVVIEAFVPRDTSVVMGSGNSPLTEVHEDACRMLDIPVLRRYGGGGTVVLYPGCVVVTVGAWVKDPFNNSFYFERLNSALIGSLVKGFPNCHGLGQAGISDLVFGVQKIAGTSLFRSRNYLLYQASILVDLDRDLVGRLLQHPTKEPDYRRGRSHQNFLTSMREVDPSINSSAEVCEAVRNFLGVQLSQTLDGHLIGPIESQMSALKARLIRAEETQA